MSREKSDKVEQNTENAGVDFDELFEKFTKFGARNADEISLRNIDKWFEQANIFDKNLTKTDTGINFSKVAKGKKRLTKDEFREFLNQLAQDKQMESSELESKLNAAGSPSFTRVTRPVSGSIVAEVTDRLTDPSSYTGSHKERFDKEGHGKGMEGRYEVVDDDGYVRGYKSKGSYSSSEEDDDEEKEK